MFKEVNVACGVCVDFFAALRECFDVLNKGKIEVEVDVYLMVVCKKVEGCIFKVCDFFLVV